MLRFLSFLLVLFGLAAAAYGVYGYMQEQAAVESADSEPEILAAELPPAIDVRPGGRPLSRSLSGPSGSGLDGLEDLIGVESVGNEVEARRDDFMSSLQTVPIAHETPTRAQFGRAFEVTVAIDATGDSTAVDALPGRGEIVESTAQISADVQATLSGSSFEIEAITPLLQTVSPVTENVWRWNVTPLESGAHELVIELFALDGNRAMPVRTFRDSVEVRVTRLGQVIAAAASVSPIAAVVGGIGSVLAGLLGILRIFRRS